MSGGDDAVLDQNILTPITNLRTLCVEDTSRTYANFHDHLRCKEGTHLITKSTM